MSAPPARAAWWMFPVLALVDRYAPGCVPAPVLRRSRALCPAWLRNPAPRYTLHQVSWSNLRIHAFPGYEWSRSFGEAPRVQTMTSVMAACAEGGVLEA